MNAKKSRNDLIMDDDLQELYQDVILEHNRSPRNYRAMSDATSSDQGYNPNCGDDVTVFVKIFEDKISDVSFVGEGCALSQSSASLMTEIVVGKSVNEALKIVQEICKCLSNPECSIEDLLVYGDIAALIGVRKFPMRIKCATLAWHALESAINKYSK